MGEKPLDSKAGTAKVQSVEKGDFDLGIRSFAMRRSASGNRLQQTYSIASN
jgi:hypothetical protein